MKYKRYLNQTLLSLTIICMGLASIIAIAEEPRNHAAQVLYDASLHHKFHDFCTHVLKIQTLNEWNDLLQEIKTVYPQMPTDKELYQQLKISYAKITYKP